MTNITTPIIPLKQSFASVTGPSELHLEAICVFVSIGFFLDTDTYWKNEKVLAPAHVHQLNENGFLERSTPYFKWTHEPRNISFNQALDEFMDLFESIVQEQTQGKKVILALSGGLDSRTQAVALKNRPDEVYAYSYDFSGGFAESRIANKIAKTQGFEFESFKIPRGYLWEKIDDLAEINGCYSDFTSPRQMAVRGFLKEKGDLFSLGHWGDVLFDDMKVEDDMTFEMQVEALVKKLIKPGGFKFAQQLWQYWGLEGNFEDYFRERIKALLKKVDIAQSANAQIRAFKSLYWAPRWTSVSLAVFESVKPMALPYYDNRMCEFICTVPEEFLKNRKLQIAYIKAKAPQLAKITWQDHRPFNLYNYPYDKVPYNLCYKIASKAKRVGNTFLGKPYIMRNWELQFLGQENKGFLESHIHDGGLLNWLSKPLAEEIMSQFYANPVPKTAHPLNMLLVLAKFNKFNASRGSGKG